MSSSSNPQNSAKKTEKSPAGTSPHATLRRTTLIVVPICVVLALFGWLQMRDLDNGIIETYARQQDSYVGIVLNEIGLDTDRSTDEVISDILGTLHNSSGSYWAFSRGQTMLYVKDVVETNRYKDVSADTYFDSADAEDFLKSLEEGQIVHQRILLGNEDYLASGTLFDYDGSEYRLCLLTNVSALLGNNDYQGAHARMGTLWACGIVLFCTGMMVTADSVDRRRRECDSERAKVALLSEKLALQAERDRRMDLYSAREGAWDTRLVVRFAKKLRARGVGEGAVLRVGCTTLEEALELLERCNQFFGNDVLRFHDAGDCEVTLLCAHETPDGAADAVKPLLQGNAQIIAAESLDGYLANADESGRDSNDGE
ncbi:MAG: hypothetical protein SOH69_02970 [Olsenella sp.]